MSVTTQYGAIDCVEEQNVVTCTSSFIPVGYFHHYSVGLGFPPGQLSNEDLLLTTEATVTHTALDPDLSNNMTQETTTLVACRELELGRTGKGDGLYNGPYVSSPPCRDALHWQGAEIDLTAQAHLGWRVTGWSGTDDEPGEGSRL